MPLLPNILLLSGNPELAEILAAALAGHADFRLSHAASATEADARLALDAPVLVLAEEGFPAPTGRQVIFFSKPLKVQELVASITTRLKSLSASYPFGNAGDFLPQERLLTRAGEAPVALTEKEAALLLRLCESPAPVSREALLEAGWGEKQALSDHTLETHLYRLRRKITEAYGENMRILLENGHYFLHKER